MKASRMSCEVSRVENGYYVTVGIGSAYGKMYIATNAGDVEQLAVEAVKRVVAEVVQGLTVAQP